VLLVVLRDEREVMRWELSWPSQPDLALVDGLARLQLAARRAGCSLVVRDLCPDLERLLDLVGLRVEVCGQPEGGEEVRIEERVHPDDPVP
jgi:hypothetical protein